MNKNRYYDPFEMVNAWLIVNGYKVLINKSPFLLGKDGSKTDLRLDSQAVSRVHAKIIYEQFQYYYIDNNSTNRSSINGSNVLPNVKHRLKNNDHLLLADVEVIFIEKE